MEEEATIREMESKELTERNEQLRRETGELRLVLILRRITSWFIHYSNFTSYQLTVFFKLKLRVDVQTWCQFAISWFARQHVHLTVELKINRLAENYLFLFWLISEKTDQIPAWQNENQQTDGDQLL